MKKKTSLKIIFFWRFFETSSSIPSHVWHSHNCEYVSHRTSMIMKLMNTYRRFRFVFILNKVQKSRDSKSSHRNKEGEKKSFFLPCLWRPDHRIMPIVRIQNNNNSEPKKKWKLSNLINNKKRRDTENTRSKEIIIWLHAAEIKDDPRIIIRNILKSLKYLFQMHKIKSLQILIICSYWSRVALHSVCVCTTNWFSGLFTPIESTNNDKAKRNYKRKTGTQKRS